MPLLLFVSTSTHRSSSYLISACFSLTLESFTQKVLRAVLPTVFLCFYWANACEKQYCQSRKVCPSWLTDTLLSEWRRTLHLCVVPFAGPSMTSINTYGADMLTSILLSLLLLLICSLSPPLLHVYSCLLLFRTWPRNLLSLMKSMMIHTMYAMDHSPPKKNTNRLAQSSHHIHDERASFSQAFLPCHCHSLFFVGLSYSYHCWWLCSTRLTTFILSHTRMIVLSLHSHSFVNCWSSCSWWYTMIIIMLM